MLNTILLAFPIFRVLASPIAAAGDPFQELSGRAESPDVPEVRDHTATSPLR